MMRSPDMLNSGWFEPGVKQYLAPNLVAEAAKDFGVSDDRARLAIARAALVDGRKVGQWDEAVAAAVAATGVVAAELRKRAESSDVLERARVSTAEFHALKADQRPAFLISNHIGDRAAFSGVVAIGPLEATLDAMLQDATAYESYASHHGSPPKT